MCNAILRNFNDKPATSFPRIFPWELVGKAITTTLDNGVVVLCTYQRPTRGVDPGDIRENSAGLADFCRRFLVQNEGIGSLLHFRGKIQGERPAGFVTSPPSWKWKIQTALTGFQNGDGEKGKRVLRFSGKSVPFCWSSIHNKAKILFCKKSVPMISSKLIFF